MSIYNMSFKEKYAKLSLNYCQIKFISIQLFLDFNSLNIFSPFTEIKLETHHTEVGGRPHDMLSCTYEVSLAFSVKILNRNSPC